MNDANASNSYVSGEDNNRSENFAEFLKTLTNENDENEISESVYDRLDFPRMKTNEIDNFRYHNIDQFNTNFGSQKTGTNDLKTINLNIRGLQQNYHKNLELHTYQLYDILMETNFILI